MLTETNDYSESLGNNLILRSVRDESDVDRLAKFNGHIHDETVDVMTRNLIMKHPHTRPKHWFFVENENTGEIVSSLCVIPWVWKYEGVEIKSGEMGIVGTLENYRNRGLMRALANRHFEILVEEEFDLSHIQGIPYIYRLFGYEYALPLEGGWRVELHQIQESEHAYTFRMATTDDISDLLRLSDDMNQTLAISAKRDEGIWAYMLEDATDTDTAGDTWVILNDKQSIIGYFRVAHGGFGIGLNLAEASPLSLDMAIAVLGKLKALAIEKEKPFIRLNIQRNHMLIDVANHRGAHDTGTYAWQIKIVDVVRLLTKMAPIFERRIAESGYANLTQNVIINLYKEAFEMRFMDGCLEAVEAVGFKEGGDLSIPPNVFVPLVLGYRNREELSANYPDVGCWEQNRVLIDVLFPKGESFIYTIY